MFSYQALATPTSIRLILLHPGESYDPLNLSLVTDDLDTQAYKYEAISYFWGPPILSQRIKVDGQDLNITQNLFDALIRLRLPDKDRILWADGICINQTSVDEKSQQVKLMRKIFAQCKRGIVYLGLEANGSELVCDFLGSLVEWLSRESRSGNPAWENGRFISSQLNSLRGLPPDDNPGWSALASFLQRPWFRRVWTIQEFALPPHIFTICGHWELDGDYLSLVIYSLVGVVQLGSIVDRGLDDTANETISRAIVLIQKHFSLRLAVGRQVSQLDIQSLDPKYRNPSIYQGHISICSLVDWAFLCEVTDPRDRFFGLLGLAIDLENEPDLQPDYHKTLQEVENGFSSVFIRRGWGSELLAQAQYPITSSLSQPSWRTAWAYVDEATDHYIKSAIVSEEVIKSDKECLQAAISKISHSHLAVKAFEIDEIRRVTSERLDGLLGGLDGILTFEPMFNALHPSDRFFRLVLQVLMLNKTYRQESPVAEAYLDICQYYIGVILGCSTFGSLVEVMTEYSRQQHIQQLQNTLMAFSHSKGRRFGITRAGYAGIFHPVAQEGDQIVMINGDVKTFLVRPQPHDNTVLWLGEIYVHDFEEQIEKSLRLGSLVNMIVA